MLWINLSRKDNKIIIEKDIIWKSYNIFTSFFEQSGIDGHITFKRLTTKMVNNIDDLKIFFEIIAQLIEKEKIDKKGIIKILWTKNNILEQMKTTKEFNNIFSLISKIRNAIKGKTKKSNDETTNLISNIFWNNEILDIFHN